MFLSTASATPANRWFAWSQHLILATLRSSPGIEKITINSEKLEWKTLHDLLVMWLKGRKFTSAYAHFKADELTLPIRVSTQTFQCTNSAFTLNKLMQLISRISFA